MSKAGEDDGQMRISHEGRGGGLLRFCVTFAIIFVILWGTAYLALRTDQGHAVARDRLSARLGIPVTIESVRLAFPLCLVFRGVASGPAGAAEPSLHVRELRVAIGMRQLVRLTVRAPELTLVWNEGGTWSPAPFSKLGELPGAPPSAVAGVAGEIPRAWRVDVDDGQVRWVTHGEQIAAVSGLRFTGRGACVPGHRMRYYRLAFKDALLADGGQVSESRIEWLSSTALPFVSLTQPDAVPQSWFGTATNHVEGVTP